ncbi:hypothetical protein GCM10027299_09180 [Larkinella ripae]
MTPQLKAPAPDSDDPEVARFTVKSPDMKPTLKPGDRVQARLIPPTQWPTIHNRVVCVETNDGFAPLIMRLTKNKRLQTAHLALHSEPDRYGRTVDIGVPLTVIDKIWQLTHRVEGFVD